MKVRDFNNESLNISLTCYKEPNNKLVFIGNQAARILRYADPDGAIRRHVKPKYKREFGTGIIGPVETTGVVSPVLQPRTIGIYEPGLWALIFGSKLPIAEDFKDWVFEVVLPQIRETGAYAVQQRNIVPALPQIPIEKLRAITNEEIIELNNVEKQIFRYESLAKSELAKNQSCVESGKRGGTATKDRWEELIQKEKENKFLKGKVKYLEEIRCDRLLQENAKLQNELDAIVEFVVSW